MSGGESKSAWVTRSNSATKPWGAEISWTAATSSVKTISLKAGKRTSFKFNRVKDEMLICGAGKIKVYFGDEEIITQSRGDLNSDYLTPGSALVVQSGCPYRLEAIEDAIVLEVSTNRASSSVRLHDDYNRKVKKISEHVDRIITKWFPS